MTARPASSSTRSSRRVLGGLFQPCGLVFDEAGLLYVAHDGVGWTSQVLRYEDSTQAALSVTLSSPSALPVTVDYTTFAGTAETGSDFELTSGSLTFDPHQTTGTILVPIVQDAIAESPETFLVSLSDPSDSTELATGEVTIVEAARNSYPSNDVPKEIKQPRNSNAPPAVTTSTLEVTTSGQILDLNVQLDITHTKCYELTVTLFAPDGTPVPLFSKVGYPASLMSASSNIVLDDEATRTVLFSSLLDFAGAYQPEGTLADFDAEDMAGVWTLEIVDDVDKSYKGTGTLNGWSLDIVTYEPVSNNAPVAVDDADATQEDTGVTVNVLANDWDPDGDAIQVASVTQGANGSVVNNGDGTVTYTPNLNFNGTDSFTYQAYDGADYSTPATVTISVDLVNDAPVAVDDTATTPQDTPVIVAVLANDTDVDGDFLAVDSFSQAANGTVVHDGDGQLTYTPTPATPAFIGEDSFTYAVSDGNGGTDTATVNVTVTRLNAAPVAGDDAYATDEDTQLAISAPGVRGNDSDADGDPITAILVAGPTDGALTLNADGSFTYEPDSNFNGSDSFIYKANDTIDDSNLATVTITVNPVNDAPTITSSPVTDATERSPYTYDVDADDSDVGDVLTFSLDVDPVAGMTIDPATGVIQWTPAIGEAGDYLVTVTVTDAGLLSNTQSYPLTVAEVASELSFPSTDGPIDILDQQTVFSSIDISDTGATVGDLSLRILLTHERSGDLTARLRGPNGFDVDITEPILSGDYAHEYVISGATGQDLDGTWTLALTDNKKRKVGTLQEWTMTVETASLLRVDVALAGSAGSQAVISQQDAERATAAAFALWTQQVNATASLNLDVQVADLPAGTLGWAYGNTIALDLNANGAGWYMDRAAPASGQFDLLTVVTHEIGHLLGYGHSLDTLDVMAATLPAGTRRLPGVAPVTTHAPLESVLAAPLLLHETRLNVKQADLVGRTLLESRAVSDTGADLDIWLLPLERPQSSLAANHVRLLNDIADEETELLDEELLALLARAVW